MKIQKPTTITNSMVENFRKLRSKAEANTRATKPSYVPIWGLEYSDGKTKGAIDAFGNITNGKTKVRVDNDKITRIHKPFLMTWSTAMKRVNNMLSKMIEKFDDKNIVKQNQVDVFVADSAFVKRVEQANKKLLEEARNGKISLAGDAF